MPRCDRRVILRVKPGEKERIRRPAERAGLDVSTRLRQLAPDDEVEPDRRTHRWAELREVREVREAEERRTLEVLSVGSGELCDAR